MFDACLSDARLFETQAIEAPENLLTEGAKSIRSIFGGVGFAGMARVLCGSVAMLVVLLSVVGAGAQTAHFVGSQWTVNSTAVSPVGVAVDGHGNVFVADTGGTCSGVGELVAVNGAISPSTTITCLPVPSTYTNLGASSQRGVAVDGQGNVYVVATNMFYEIALDSGGKISSSSAATLIDTGTGGLQFCAVAAGVAGSVYVLDCGTETLWQHTSGSANLTDVADGFSAPVSVAVDANGNAFVVDQGGSGSAVYEVPAGSSALPVGSLTKLAAPSAGWQTPVGVAVDAGGNVYVGSKGGSAVYEIVASGGAVSGTSMVKAVATESNLSSLALSGNGNFYIGNNGSAHGIAEFSTQTVNLGSVAVGSSSSIYTLTLQFDSAGAINAPWVLTQGAAGLDFTDAGTGSCTTTNGAANPYAINSTCTVNVQFKPTAVGVRTGVVELPSSTNAVIAKAWLSGTGLGARMNVDSANSTTYSQTDGNPLVHPISVSVDEAGDLFVADDQNKALYELLHGSSTLVTISTAFSSPYATALDAAGNLYLADSGKTAIYLFANINIAGGFTDAGYAYSALFPATTTFGGSTLTSPQGLAIGPDATLYIADVVSATSGRIVTYNLTTGATGVRAGGLIAPHGIAFDASGNLYVADQSSGSILEYSGSGATVSQTFNLTGIVSDFAPWGLAVDPSGSLLVADTASGRIVRIPNENGKLTVADATTLETDYYSAFALAQDAAGNLYAADEADGVVYRYARTQASLNFGSVKDGSSAATQSVTLESTGNVAVSTLATTFSDAAFTQTNNCLPISLWGVCTATLGFSPSASDSGALTGSLAIGPSTSSTWVTITLSGTAIMPTAATPTFSIPAGTYLTTQSVSLSDATSGATIYYTIDGSTPSSSSTKYTSGTAISVAASETIKAIAVAANYNNSAVASTTYYINPSAIAPTLALTASPVNGSPFGSSVLLTATLSGVSGTTVTGDTVIFYTGTTEIGTGTVATIAGNTVARLTTPSLPAGVNLLTAYYVGHGSTYLSSTSPVLSYSVSLNTATTLAMSSTVSGVTTALSSGGTIASGKPVTLTAAVASTSGSLIPVGQVNFCNAAANSCSDINRIGTAQLNSAGTASITFYPGAGSYSYSAVYAGAPNAVVNSAKMPFLGSTSATQTLTVSASAALEATTTTLVNTTGGTTPPYTVTATVTASGSYTSSLNGTAVSFLDASNGNAILTTANLSGNTQTLNFRDPSSTDPAVGLSGAHNSVVLGDFDSDGIQDMAVSSYLETSGTNQVTLFKGKGDGTFTQQGSAIATDAVAGRIVAGDFNGDGRLDFAVVTNAGVNVFLNTGNWSVSKTSYNLGSTFGTGFNSIALGDFNGDGNLDLALTFSNGIVNTVAFLLGKGDGTFTVQSASCTRATSSSGTTGAGCPALTGLPSDVAVGDFNEDGVLDLVAVDRANGKVDVLLGAGDGTFAVASGSPYTVGNYPMSVTAGRFNGDSHLDLAVANYIGGSVSILQGTGTGSFAAASYSPVTVGNPNSIAIGDFNGDGVADLAVYTPTQLVPLVGNGAGFTSLTPISLPTLSLYPLSVAEIAVGDLNGDGLSDFVAVNPDGTATTELAQFTQTATAATSITSSLPNILTGLNQVKASYPGTTTYAASSSNNVGLQMATATTLSLVASPTNVTSGSSVALTATLKPTASVAAASGESVKFYLNGSATAFATAALNSSGVATLNTTTLPTGTDSITASYAGDATLGASSASAVTVTVAGAATQLVRVSGNGQSAAISSAFANPLVVEVEDANGIAVPGATVNFASIPATGGASATLSSASAVTGSTGTTVGIASVTATANAIAGSYSVTASITGGISASFSLTNNLVLTTASLNSGTVGVAYSQTLSAGGAVGSVTYSITSGALPAGITLTSAGVLSGTPTAGGTFSNITIKATDSASNTASKTYSLTIASPTISLQAGSPPAGTYGAAYSQTIPSSNISGGTAPYSFALASGSTLAPGLTLSASGTLSGTPTKAGSFSFTVVATDSSTGSGPYSGSQSYTLTINQAALTVTPNAASKTYGTANPTFTGTVTGMVAGDGITATYASGATTTTAAGVYSIGANAIAATLADPNSKLTNYTVTYNLGTLTVNSAALTVTPNAASKTYGTANPTFTGTITGMVAGDGITATYASGATATTAAGVYSTGANAIAATLADPNSKLSNYTVTYNLGTLTINPATPTLSFATIPAVTYGNAPFTVSATSASTGAVTYSVATGSPATINSTTGLVTLTGAGSVTLNASQAATANYSAATATVTFNVAAASQTISFTQPTSPVIYGVSPTTLVATGGGSPSPVTFSVTGPASINGSTLTITGAGTLVVTASQAATANYAAATPVSRTIVVSQATPLAGVSSSVSTIFAQNAVTLTATVASVACSPTGTVSGSGWAAFCTPTGNVTFLSGQTALGTVALNNGGAQLTTSALPTGTDSITAVYGGDANFLSVTSGAASVTVVDFTIVTGSSTGDITLTALPGSGLTYNFAISPSNGATTIPGAVSLTLSGLPSGATYVFSPATIAAGSGTTSVSLTLQLPLILATLQPKAGPMASRLAPLSLALLLLPFAGRMRRRSWRMRSKQSSRLFSILLLLGAGMIAMAGISGCGSPAAGYFNQAPKSYNLTVTAASGSLSHTSNITLNVE